MKLPRLQRGFTLVEVLVAMFVLAVFATGLLATTWRLVGIARDYVDSTAADNYCHDVIYAATQSKDRFGGSSELSWKIDPMKGELPRIVSTNLLNREEITYMLWRSKDSNKLPTCTVKYSGVLNDGAKSNLVVTVYWTDLDGKPQHRSAYATCK